MKTCRGAQVSIGTWERVGPDALPPLPPCCGIGLGFPVPRLLGRQFCPDPWQVCLNSKSAKSWINVPAYSGTDARWCEIERDRAEPQRVPPKDKDPVTARFRGYAYFARDKGWSASQACSCTSFVDDFAWRPSGCAMPLWGPTHGAQRFCRLLGGKKLLFIGHST